MTPRVRGRGPLTQRFWLHVAKGDGCWAWTGSTNGKGYGKTFDHGRFLLAHRVSWELTKGEIPDGALILHKCDNRRCVRPDHLFIGTHRDNTQDMLAKGRGGHRRKGKAWLAREAS